MHKNFSRKGAKTQRKPQETRQRSAPLRLCVRNLLRRYQISWLLTFVFFTSVVAAQTPSPTPPDKRGLGIQSGGQTSTSSTDQRSREAKPELVLQTGYNNFYGATRLVFSPDGKLLATATIHSNTISLWETATNRKLRDLSTSGQNTPAFAPGIAFSRDSRLIATTGGDNSVTVWDVMSGRELQTLAGTQGTMMASVGIYFLAFT